MTKESLKQKFVTGAKLTQDDFHTLIDLCYGNATEEQLDALSSTLLLTIGSKADSVSVDDLGNALEAVEEDLAGLPTFDDLNQGLSTKAESKDVYSKEETDSEIESAISTLNEEIGNLRDQISSLEGEIEALKPVPEE